MMSIFGALVRPGLRGVKGGIVQLTQSLATRVGRRQHPGQRGAAGLDRHRAHARAPRGVPDLHDRVLARIPDGRWGEEQDMAGIAVFLAAVLRFITGTAIPVDGGYSSLGI